MANSSSLPRHKLRWRARQRPALKANGAACERDAADGSPCMLDSFSSLVRINLRLTKVKSEKEMALRSMRNPARVEV
jgi:hypothetical protein